MNGRSPGPGSGTAGAPPEIDTTVAHSARRYDYLSEEEAADVRPGRYGVFHPGSEPGPRPTAAEAYTYCAVARVS